MQIHRIHDEHHPFPTAGGPHSGVPNSSVKDSQSVSSRTETQGSSQNLAVSKDIQPLLERLQLLPEENDELLQLAQERFRSGELITREVAELVATSSLKDFIF